MGIRQDQCNKVCRIIDDYLANRPRERDELIVAVRTVFKEADRKTESNSEIPNNPQYEMGMGTLRCDNCSEYGSYKCTKCDGEMYFKRLEPKDEPQTDNGIGCSRCEGRFDCYDRDMPHAVHCNNYGKITDEPQERSE